MASPILEDILDRAGQPKPSSGNPYLDDILQEQKTPPKKPRPTPTLVVPPQKPPAKPAENPYLDDILTEQREREARLRFTLGTAAELNPAKPADVRDLARQHGLPPAGI